jgi:multidrug efflux pump subunit AcrA (membrane-fusion protein)
MSETDPTAPAPESTEPPEAAPEDLGDAGKRALEAERKARRAAEKAATEATAKVKQYEDAQKTEAERLAAQVAELEARAAKAEAAEMRTRIIAETGISAELARFVTGATEDEMREAAEVLRANVAAPKTPTAPPTIRPVESLQPGSGTPQQSGPVQLSRSDLARMSPADIEAARLGGQLADLMAGQSA